MKKFIFIIALLPYFVLAQNTKIKELKFEPNPKFGFKNGKSITFPLIDARNDLVGKKINDVLKTSVLNFSSKFSNRDLNTELKDYIDVGLVELKYKVSLNNNEILSISLSAETCEKTCSIINYYFNFDLNTGQLLTIEDIIKKEKMPVFVDSMIADKAFEVKKYKADLKKKLLSKSMDSTMYWKCMSVVDSRCSNGLQFVNFTISNKEFIIKDECEFPNSFRNLSPTFNIIYDFKKIEILLTESIKLKIK